MSLVTRERVPSSGEGLRGMPAAALESMFVSFPDAVIYTDVERRIVACNPAAERLFGYSHDELVGRSMRFLYIDDEEFHDHGELAWTTSAPVTEAYDVRYRKKNGATFWSQTQARPVQGRDGELIGRIRVIRDVTRQRRREARRELLARMAAELERRISPLAKLQAAARIAVQTVAAACTIHLVQEDGAPSLAVAEHRDPEKLPLLAELHAAKPALGATSRIRRAVETGEPLVVSNVDDAVLTELALDEARCALVRAIGTRSIVIAPLVVGGETIGALTLSDTEVGSFDEELPFAVELARRLATTVATTRLEQEAERHRDRFVRVQEMSPDGFVLLRPVRDDAGALVDFTLAYQNAAAARMMGVDRAAPVGVRVFEAVPSLRKLFDSYREVLETGKSASIEQCLELGGAKRWFSLTATSIGDELAVSFSDETDAKGYQERLGVLGSATAALVASLVPERILAEVAELAVPALADCCAIDLVEEDGTIRRAGVAHANPTSRELLRLWWTRFPPTREPRSLGTVFRARQPTGIVDIQRILESEPEVVDAEAARALGLRESITAPIASRERAFGALSLVMAESTRRFSSIDVEIASELATRIGLALENARLFHRERQARDQISKLQRLTAALASAVTPSDVARAACHLGTEAAGAPFGVVWLREHADLVLAAMSNVPAEAVAGDERIPLGARHLAVRVLETGEPHWLDRLDHQDPAFDFARPEAEFRAAALLPIGRGEAPLGVLLLGFDAPRAFSPEARTLFETVARHCGAALERARLDEVKRRATAHEALLAKAGEAFSASMDYDAMLRSVVEVALPELGDFGFFDMVDGGRVVRTPAAFEDDETLALLRSMPVPPHEQRTVGVCALCTGEPAIHPRIDDAWRSRAAVSPEHLDAMRRLAIVSLISVPVRIEGELAGALTLCFRNPDRHHDEDDLRLATELARRASMSLTHARLLRRAQEAALRAEEAGRIRDEFLATVSHELRTPLTAIVGWTSILRKDTKLPASAQKGIEVIRRNAYAQVRLVEDILDVSRIITGKLKVEPQPVDAIALVRQALEVVRPSADAKEIGLSFDAPTEPIFLVADPDRFQQVAWNLLSNAVKFTERRGNVRIDLEKVGAAVSLVVADDGRGIDPEFLPYVFDRFRQADSSTRRSYGGLGLGLAIVRHIVELHGGRVAAESDGVGQGARFTVTFPIRAVASPAAGVAPSLERPAVDAEPRAPIRLDDVHVLVVDDEPDARELLGIVLGEAGARVTTAGSASQAMESLVRAGPHVLVSDLGMPGEDGYDLIRRVRALGAGGGGQIPSIALTAYTRADDRRRALTAGFTTHVSKPVSPEDLVAAVASLAMLTRPSRL